ncbi:uncharacterized [Tachysurus ichikawai]
MRRKRCRDVIWQRVESGSALAGCSTGDGDRSQGHRHLTNRLELSNWHRVEGWFDLTCLLWPDADGSPAHVCFLNTRPSSRTRRDRWAGLITRNARLIRGTRL